MPSSMPANTPWSRRCSSSARALRISATRLRTVIRAAAIAKASAPPISSAAVNPQRQVASRSRRRSRRASSVSMPASSTRAASIVRLCCMQQRQRFAGGAVALRRRARRGESTEVLVDQRLQRVQPRLLVRVVGREPADLVQLRLPARAGLVIRRQERIGAREQVAAKARLRVEQGPAQQRDPDPHLVGVPEPAVRVGERDERIDAAAQQREQNRAEDQSFWEPVWPPPWP